MTPTSGCSEIHAPGSAQASVTLAICRSCVDQGSTPHWPSLPMETNHAMISSKSRSTSGTSAGVALRIPAGGVVFIVILSAPSRP